MIDKRVVFSREPQALRWQGKTYPFDPLDSASRYAAEAQLAQDSSAWIARLEKLAGKTLTTKELLHGPTKKDERTAYEKVRDAQRKVVPMPDSEPQEDSNPYEHPALKRKKRETPDQARQRLAKDWESRNRPPKPDPHAEVRQRARDASRAHLEWALYSPDSSQKDIDDARLALAQCGGCLDTAAELLSAISARREKISQSKLDDLDSAMAELRAAKREIKSFDAEPSADEQLPARIHRSLASLHGLAADDPRLFD